MTNNSLFIVKANLNFQRIVGNDNKPQFTFHNMGEFFTPERAMQYATNLFSNTNIYIVSIAEFDSIGDNYIFKQVKFYTCWDYNLLKELNQKDGQPIIDTINN